MFSMCQNVLLSFVFCLFIIEGPLLVLLSQPGEKGKGNQAAQGGVISTTLHLYTELNTQGQSHYCY